jgi:hypothetical protein
MKLYPEYSENIIVYVVANDIGQWYVTEKELWFLDRDAFSKAFGVQSTEQNIAFAEALNAGNFDILLKEIEPYKVDTNELNELIGIYPRLSKDESVLEMRPSLYINIDTMIMKNLFPEPSGVFEKYAPKNWQASFENFWSEIPECHNYWCVNGNSHF